jgi:NADH-quinone oxidoreductase subunit E
MARLSTDNVQRARDLVALYPQPRSAMIPILHLAQEQDGYLTEEAMVHIAEILGLAPAEVYGTATFYDMIFTEPVGRYLISVCTNIACLLNGGYELLEHAEERLGVKAGGTTPDGEFTLEEVECIALCGNAPCLTVNWRFFGDVTNEAFDRLVDDVAAGRRAEEIPPHGTLCRVRRSVGLLAGTPSEGGPRPEPGSTGGQPEGEKQTGYGESQPRTAGDVAAAPGQADAVASPQAAPDDGAGREADPATAEAPTADTPTADTLTVDNPNASEDSP